MPTSFSALDALLVAVLLATAWWLARPAVSRNRLWQATVTPLASIIGSGFLVLGPLLDNAYGGYAPLAMALLCAAAWVMGAAVRFNIARLDAQGHDRSSAERRLERMASWALSGAYVISVTYYLNLFGSFGVSLTPLHETLHGRVLTSAVLLVILGVGWTKGFKALEGLEQVSVTVKLAVIAALAAGLAVHFGEAGAAGTLHADAPRETGWQALTLGFGLIVTVQGFETSRYLGATYDAPTRIRSMRLAQIIATLIYLVYIALVSYAVASPEGAVHETAVIGMMREVAPVLPLLLVVAALSAQFSAAVADTVGCGGLVEEESGGRLGERQAYGVLVAVGLALTWTSGVFEIIAYASRAFALYYALQAAIAALGARRDGRMHLAAGFALVAALALAVTVFGTPAEG
ncbi:MAG: hypothetical protein CMN86_03435 [Stappia sp.]|nr:hypothetical protein [Stappia sp.]